MQFDEIKQKLDGLTALHIEQWQIERALEQAANSMEDCPFGSMEETELAYLVGVGYNMWATEPGANKEIKLDDFVEALLLMGKTDDFFSKTIGELSSEHLTWLIRDGYSLVYLMIQRRIAAKYEIPFMDITYYCDVRGWEEPIG